jgi:hypothetical protein
VPPGRKLVGPGLDGIDIASRLLRDERADPPVIAVVNHRRAAPFPIILETPDQRAVDLIMTVAVDIRPDFDAFAGDPLHGKAAAVDLRVDILDMKSAAGCSALDSLSGFVHGDATDMRKTPHFFCVKRDASVLYTKPLTGYWFPGNSSEDSELNTAILFLHQGNFATPEIVACKQRAE